MRTSRSAYWAALAALLLATSCLVAPALSQEDEGVDVEEDDDYEDEYRAFLLVKKAVVEEVVVQGRNFTVKLDFYNTGTNTAQSIKISEPALPDELQLVAGALKGEIPSLAPGKHASWKYTVVSSSSGRYVAPPCTVTYQADSDADSVQETMSTIFAAAILTPTQKTLNTVLKGGSYMTFGLLNTANDWRNAGISVAVIALLVGFNWTYAKVVQTTSDRRRQRALEELEGSK